jgi:hypothetical protein
MVSKNVRGLLVTKVAKNIKLCVIKIAKYKECSSLTSIQNPNSLLLYLLLKSKNEKDGPGNWPMSNVLDIIKVQQNCKAFEK